MSGLVFLAREMEEARRQLRISCRKWLHAQAARQQAGPTTLRLTEGLLDDLADLILSAREDASEIVRTAERQRAAAYMRFDDGSAHSLAEDIASGRHMAEPCEHHEFNHHGCRDCARLYDARYETGARSTNPRDE